MADSHDAALRDYLIGILEADGPESAQRRLALRNAWHQRHSSKAAETPPFQTTPSAAERNGEWEQLAALADRLPTAVDTDIIQSLKNSAWLDVQDAAQQLLDVRRHWKAITEIWPRELDARLQDLFLRILNSPATRTAPLREQFRRELDSSKSSRRAFRRFADRFRREFGALTAYDPELLTELSQPLPPTGAAQPTATRNANRTEWSMGTAALIFCGVLGGIIGGLTSSKHRPTPPPQITFPSPQLPQPITEQMKANQHLQDILKRFEEEKRKFIAEGRTGRMGDDPEITARVLIDPEILNRYNKPADALQPANRSASGDSP